MPEVIHQPQITVRHSMLQRFWMMGLGKEEGKKVFVNHRQALHSRKINDEDLLRNNTKK